MVCTAAYCGTKCSPQCFHDVIKILQNIGHPYLIIKTLA